MMMGSLFLNEKNIEIFLQNVTQYAIILLQHSYIFFGTRDRLTLAITSALIVIPIMSA